MFVCLFLFFFGHHVFFSWEQVVVIVSLLSLQYIRVRILSLSNKRLQDRLDAALSRYWKMMAENSWCMLISGAEKS